MCGIAGFIDETASTADDQLRAIANRMALALRHRGPDDSGVWTDPAAGVALGHRRLSIIDLSPCGHQPMVSHDGRFVIVYNGEIYNYRELRHELESLGVRFRGSSDTEVLLEVLAAHPVERALERLNGMFAFALWDRQERTLTLARDRLGIKPAYWGRVGTRFVFGSELKALRACPGWTPVIDRRAVASFLRHKYVPAPNSIYEGIQKLEPGTYLVARAGAVPTITRYWSMQHVARAGMRNRLTDTTEEIVARLDDLLRDAVRIRMLADVPLGAFLSGGFDSSTVAALMQAESTRPVRTFSIGFRDGRFNEAQHARAVAEHLGTEHTELYVEPEHALDVVPNLTEWYDEPFADSSQIPTYLVAEMTRHHVTVALSGDGGDELFAGYNRYFWATRIAAGLRVAPRPARAAMRAALQAVSADDWDRLLAPIPSRVRPSLIGDKLHKFAATLDAREPDVLYRRLLTDWDPDAVMLDAPEYRGILWDPSIREQFPSFMERMQFLDTVTYLPDDILTKVDRATMAVSLEARVPLLDYRVAELAWRIPQSAKVRRGKGKWILRRVLERYVPRELVERPKMGFAVPIGSWLRGPLRGWGEELLSERSLREAGLVQPDTVRRQWAMHISGAHDCSGRLWDILMLQAWLARWT